MTQNRSYLFGNEAIYNNSANKICYVHTRFRVPISFHKIASDGWSLTVAHKPAGLLLDLAYLFDPGAFDTISEGLYPSMRSLSYNSGRAVRVTRDMWRCF